mgnify:CR=1 FL=1
MKQEYLTPKKTKCVYLKPKIEIQLVKLEEGISAASAVIISPAGNAQPNITDWVERKDEDYWNF